MASLCRRLLALSALWLCSLSACESAGVVRPGDASVSLPPGCQLGVDSDRDSLDDATECALGTNPSLADTDNDGLTDARESRYPAVCVASDADAQVRPPKPCVTQSDCPSGTCRGLDPNVPDSDGDGLLDGREDLEADADFGPHEVDPRLADTDGNGASDQASCPAWDQILGCVACVPRSRRCEGSVSMSCLPDGTREIAARDCSETGSSCGADGFCEDPCAEPERSGSYLGCEYVAVPLVQTGELQSALFDFRVVIANANATPVDVRIYQGATEVTSTQVDANQTDVVSLPWVPEHFVGSSGSPSIARPDGAYRIVSSAPVVVTQFNPFEYFRPVGSGAYSQTNDSSLLLPIHALGSQYAGATYRPMSMSIDSNPRISSGYLALVGTSPGTTRVEIVGAAPIAREGSGRWEATVRGETLAIELSFGEVIHLFPPSAPGCDSSRPGYVAGQAGERTYVACQEDGFDLSGSRIVADRPLAVFGGHPCAFVPYDRFACDHLETQLLPEVAWGRDYIVAPLRETPDGRNLVRVVSGDRAADVHVEVGPTAQDFSMPPHSVREFWIDEPSHIQATAAVEVFLFMTAASERSDSAERGDPSMTFVPPNEQWRKDYLLSAPSSYTSERNGQSYVQLVRSRDEAIELDGLEVVANWASVGRFEVAMVPVEGGPHRLASTSAFGALMVGFGSYTSYADPIGLNLKPINELE
jgi:IgGFc binding protein